MKRLSQELPERPHLELLTDAVSRAEMEERLALEALDWCDRTRMVYLVHDARIEWAIAVTALLAWVRYGEGES